MNEAPVTIRRWTAKERAMCDALPPPEPLSPYVVRYLYRILEQCSDIRNGIRNPCGKIRVLNVDAAEAWCWNLLALQAEEPSELRRMDNDANR